MGVAMNKGSSELNEALAILRAQNIRVGVPVIQEGLGVVIPVSGYMLRSVEILDLKRRGKLNVEAIKDYARALHDRVKKRRK